MWRKDLRSEGPAHANGMSALWASRSFWACYHALTREAIKCQSFGPVLKGNANSQRSTKNLHSLQIFVLTNSQNFSASF
jgi:hypothetical protein